VLRNGWYHRLKVQSNTKTNIVDGFMGFQIAINPVIISGNRLGIKDTTTILKERNIKTINIEIRKTAKVVTLVSCQVFRSFSKLMLFQSLSLVAIRGEYFIDFGPKGILNYHVASTDIS
jgi:hypothetical protein